MYLPAHFEQKDPAALHALMREHPLAVLVSQGSEGLTADHVPLAFEPAVASAGPVSQAPDAPAAVGLLRGHVARANPLWRQANGQAVLVVFQGPQAYVTPSWYPTKAATHKVVPTWNYAVVHAHGRLRAVDDAPWLRALVGDLTDRHEQPRNTPWAVDDAPPDYVAQMLSVIVGIEIVVDRLVGKWKLSQNRSTADRQGVVDGLHAEPVANAQALASFMRPAA